MDLDHLCVLPGDSDLALENGGDGHRGFNPDADPNDDDAVKDPSPIAYRKSPSGLGEFKKDIQKAMMEGKERAHASAKAAKARADEAKKKKGMMSGLFGSSNKIVPAANAGAAAADKAAADEKEETAKKEKELEDEETKKMYEGQRAVSDGNIQANVFMISGCEDSQTSADVSNVDSFSLPDPNGRAGGACTSALLKVLYANGLSGLTFVQVLSKMRTILKKGSYSQIPQLTSSQKLDMSQAFFIVPPNCTGTKRAVMIGINYTGQNGELSGCHNDCLNMKDFIQNECGVAEENITVLMDDGEHTLPTRANILSAYKAVAAASSDGDAVFCHYSGHGGRVRDDDYGEEEDGYDETLVPVDYSSSGQIRDDDLYTSLVVAMPQGVTLMSLMDCCHSATVLDLPYKYKADGTSSSGFNPDGLSWSVKSLICLMMCVAVLFIIVVVPLLATSD